MGLILGLLVAVGALLVVSALRDPRSLNLKRHFAIANYKTRSKHYSPELWPDVVDDLASAIRAGLALPQALSELCESGPEVLKPAFRLCRDKYLATGDFSAGLDVLAQELRDTHADKFVITLQIAHEVGGSDLGILLRTLSEVLREDLVVRGEIIARQSWTINGAKLAVAAPWATALVLASRDSAANAYASPSGIRMLILCAIVTVFAYLAMMRIAKLPQPTRLLS